MKWDQLKLDKYMTAAPWKNAYFRSYLKEQTQCLTKSIRIKAKLDLPGSMESNNGVDSIFKAHFLSILTKFSRKKN